MGGLIQGAGGPVGKIIDEVIEDLCEKDWMGRPRLAN